MKLNGVKRPIKKKNDDIITRATQVSLKGSTKTLSLSGRGFGGRRDVTVKFAMIIRPSIKKAIDLSAQAKPTCGMR